MPKLVDLIGKRFGRLVVIARDGTYKHGSATWLCSCDCGNKTIATSGALRHGKTVSCGCRKFENLEKRHRVITKHGQAKTRLHVVWMSMKTRCNNPKSTKYKYYGGRGIKVCDEWLHDFEAFRSWALANGYDESAPRGQCTLDRIDANGNYEPNNCRWVDMKVQYNNRRDVRAKREAMLQQFGMK